MQLAQLNRMLETLKESLDIQRDSAGIENRALFLLAEAGVIKRFEYTYEGFLKFLKRYLELHHSDLQAVHSPRKVIYASVEVEVCKLEEGDIFLRMADARNETSHMYGDDRSRVVLSDVPRYYAAMQAVAERFNKEFEQK